MICGQAAHPDTKSLQPHGACQVWEIHGYIGHFKLSEWWFSTSSLIMSLFSVASDECAISSQNCFALSWQMAETKQLQLTKLRRNWGFLRGYRCEEGA